jgi:sulfoxide reductase heme-binding subunit YedZ
VLPAKLQKSFLGLAVLAVAATLAAVVFEAAWYGLVNGIDPVRVLLANLDPDLAFRPAHKVLIASLLVMATVALRRLALAANKLWTRRYVQSTIPAP